MFAFGMLSGRLSQRYGSKSVLVAGLFIGIVNFAILTFAHAAQWEILLAMVVEGVGFGLAFSSMSALVVVAVPPHQTGVASGMNANIRTIGGSVGAAVMSSIVTSGVRAGDIPPQSGYTHGFALLAIAAFAATIAAFFVPGRLRPPVTMTEATLPTASSVWLRRVRSRATSPSSSLVRIGVMARIPRTTRSTPPRPRATRRVFEIKTGWKPQE